MKIKVLAPEYKGRFSDAYKFLLTIIVSEEIACTPVKAIALPFWPFVTSFDLEDIDLISWFFFSRWSFMQPHLHTKFHDCSFFESRDIKGVIPHLQDSLSDKRARRIRQTRYCIVIPIPGRGWSVSGRGSYFHDKCVLIVCVCVWVKEFAKLCKTINHGLSYT